MNHDEIIDCPKSGGDLCYKTEVNKDITNYYSLSCGFWTNTLMLEGEKYKTDMSTIAYFKERDFIEALSYIGVLPE